MSENEIRSEEENIARVMNQLENTETNQQEQGNAIENARRGIDKQTSSRDICILDTDHDIILVIGDQDNEPQRAYASRKALSLASPILKDILTDLNGPMNPNGCEVLFPEDDLKPFSWLLFICHFQFDKIPLVVSFDELFAFSVLCYKYKCANLMIPYYETWVQDLEPFKGDDKRHTEWCFIFWLCKDVRRFHLAAEHLVLSASINEDDQCVNSDGIPILKLTPMKTDWVERWRIKTVRIILDICYGFIDYLSGISTQFTYTQTRIPGAIQPIVSDHILRHLQSCAAEDETYLALQLGSFLRGLRRLSIPIERNSPELIRCSISGLCESLGTIQFRTQQEHEHCSIRYCLSQSIYFGIRHCTQAFIKEQMSEFFNVQQPIKPPERYEYALRLGFIEADLRTEPGSDASSTAISEYEMASDTDTHSSEEDGWGHGSSDFLDGSSSEEAGYVGPPGFGVVEMLGLNS